MAFVDVAEIDCDPSRARVYEHGWQSWSPTGLYPATASSPRPVDDRKLIMSYRSDRPQPDAGFQGEGLLAVALVDGPAHVFYAPEPSREVASIRARPEHDRIVVSSDGKLDSLVEDAGLMPGLVKCAEDLAGRAGVEGIATIPPLWCSWYFYWTGVTESDILSNLTTMDALGLPIEIVQIDDGYEAEIGDWLERSSGFGPLGDLTRRIRDTGRRAGIWIAPFLAGERSRLAAEHPDWLVGDTSAGENWNQGLRALDVTHPGAAEYLTRVFRTFVDDGFDYFKIDFIYAGALDGRRYADCSSLDAYREGVRTIREAIGPGPTLLGCGAPLLPSIGLVDAMRISPDVGPRYLSRDGDMSSPGMRSALAAGRARAFQHARWWINDPDCLIVRPEVERRDEWAEHVDACGGVNASSDALEALDEKGLEITRRLMRRSSTTPLDWDPHAGPDQGRIVAPRGT